MKQEYICVNFNESTQNAKENFDTAKNWRKTLLKH